MANLGNLWFGSDIDLSNLKRKIQEGNREILDSLRINYDPKSYTEMVSRLRNDLGREVFDIKVNVDGASARRTVESALAGVSGSSVSESIVRNVKVSGIDAMRQKAIDMQRTIADTVANIHQMEARLRATENAFGSNSLQARNLRTEIEAAKRANQEESGYLKNLRLDIQQANLANRSLAQSHRAAASAAREQASDSLRLNTTLSDGIHVSTRFGSALSGLFAVHKAQLFLEKVVDIGGQLEKQRVSIGAILDDTAKDNELFDKIGGLAVRSPFGILELDQFTKQLSAYEYEYHELYDMTRRIADISAGAGTDMNRLANAMGHVKSATKLTGITLKMFTMNNIPMLKMLSEYYTELEGQAVSTAEVTKRISDGLVSYSDVEAQIRRLTDAGGMFYDMQNKIADTLGAKWKNLSDAMDLMYGEIAESDIGDALKDTASILTSVAKGWREVGAALSAVGAMLLYNQAKVVYSNIVLGKNTSEVLRNTLARKKQEASVLRIASTYRKLTADELSRIASSKQLTAAEVDALVVSGQLRKEQLLRAVAIKELTVDQAELAAATYGVTRAELEQIAVTSKLTGGMRGLGMVVKGVLASIGPQMIVTAALMAGMEIYTAYTTWKDSIKSEVDTVVESARSAAQELEDFYTSAVKPKDDNSLRDRVQDMKTLLKNNNAYTQEIHVQVSAMKNVNQQYDYLLGVIQNAASEQRALVDNTHELEAAIAATSSAIETSDWFKMLFINSGGIGQAYNYIKALFTGEDLFATHRKVLDFFFNDDVKENAEEMKELSNTYRNQVNVMDEYAARMQAAINHAIEYGNVNKKMQATLKDKPLEEQIRILAKSDYWTKLVDVAGKGEKRFNEWAQNLKNSAGEVSDAWKELVEDDLKRYLESLSDKRSVSMDELRTSLKKDQQAANETIMGLTSIVSKISPEIAQAMRKAFFGWIETGEFDSSVSSLAEIIQQIVEETNKTNGIDDGSKKDTLLEKWKDRYDALKSYYEEVQKFVDLGYDISSAMSKVEELGLAPSGIFGGKEANYDNYAKLLRDLLDETSGTTDERRRFQRDIKGALGDYERDGTKEQMDKNVSIMKDYIKNVEQQWKLYRSLLEKSGGNKELASLAFQDGYLWDEASRRLLERMNERGRELGMAFSIDWDMNEEELRSRLKDANGQTQEEMVNLALEIKKIVKSNYSRFLEDSAKAYQSSLRPAETLLELERQRDEKIRARDEYNGFDPAVLSGFEHQIQSLDKQIAEMNLEVFKDVSDWGRIFGDLDSISTGTFERMLESMQKILPTLKDDAETLKIMYEYMDKLKAEMVDRSPIDTIFKSLSDTKFLRKAYKEASASATKSIQADKDLADFFHVDIGESIGLNKISDALFGASNDFDKGVKALSDKFAAIADVMSPVIALFDALGNEELSNILSIGQNALGSAATVSSGLKALGLESAGPYGAAAAAGLSILSSVFSMHDKALEKEIEASKRRQEELEHLTDNLERVLERSISGIYNLRATDDIMKRLHDTVYTDNYVKTGDEWYSWKKDGEVFRGHVSEDTREAVKEAEKTKSYYDATFASLLAQRDEVASQLKAEEDKKKSSEEAISGYEQDLYELEDQIRHFAQDMADALYGIDFKSWAQELSGVLVDAWAAGTDGAEAYRQKVSDILRDLGAKVFAERIVSKTLEPYMNEFLDLYEKENGVLTDAGIGIIANMFNEAEHLSNAANSYMDAVNKIAQERGYDLKKPSGSSGASAGIGGIKEEQADLFVSYLNSVRGSVSEMSSLQSVYLPLYSELLSRGNVLSEQQVQSLHQIASNTLRTAEAAEMLYEIIHGNVLGVNKFAVQ